MQLLSLAVRQFALPVPRVGSIEGHSGYGSTPLDGQEIHMLFQKERREDFPQYTAEKWVSWTFARKPYQFVVSGRMDGFLFGEPSTIEEIKTTFDIHSLEERLKEQPFHPYFWQLRTYGYIQYRSTGEIPKLKLILVSSRNLNSLEMIVELNPAGYEEWLNLRLQELVVEAKKQEKVFAKRQKLSREIQFPFATPRLGQVELIQTLETNLNSDTQMMIQAPTGLGKTVGILYPTLKDSLARGQKLVYVTPKNSQHLVAEEAVEKINGMGSKVRALTLTAKSKMCLKPEPLCRPDYCEYAKDFYTKLNDSHLLDKTAKIKNLSSKKLKDLGETYQVCPFELSVESVKRADVVICDYNYVFSPRGLSTKLTEAFFDEEKPNLVIDEAHNLPQRSLDYYSPSLSTFTLERLRGLGGQVVFTFRADFETALDRATSLIIALKDKGVPRLVEEPLSELIKFQDVLRNLVNRYLESSADIMPQDPVLQLNQMWSDFVSALDYRGDEYFRIFQKIGEHYQIKIVCCDASAHLSEVYKQFQNVIAFSATLKPFEYYMSLIGFNQKKSLKHEFESPFPANHRKVLLIPQVSTKLRDRGNSLASLREVVSRITAVHQGNYMVLFPSFDYLYKFLKGFHLDGYDFIVQNRETKMHEVKATLEKLRQPFKRTVLLCVQGGVYSEGVDYAGDMLIGAFVVGPALPTFDFEREKMREYYEKRYGKAVAFDYTYVYPAMSKAVQSAGRVIRSEKEKGVIVLLDPRFLEKSYSSAMPLGWFSESPRELVSKQIIKDVTEFWEPSNE